MSWYSPSVGPAVLSGSSGTSSEELVAWEDALPEGAQVLVYLRTSRIVHYSEMGFLGQYIYERGGIVTMMRRGDETDSLVVAGVKGLPILILIIGALAAAGVSIWAWESWFKQPVQEVSTLIPILLIGGGLLIFFMMRRGPQPASSTVVVVR